MRQPDMTPRLLDIVQACDHIRTVLEGVSLEAFEADWQKRWLIERGFEIISEASRHLDDAFKARHPSIPWPRVASLGNRLRHEYQRVAPEILWKVTQDELPLLERACQEELLARGVDYHQRHTNK